MQRSVSNNSDVVPAGGASHPTSTSSGDRLAALDTTDLAAVYVASGQDAAGSQGGEPVVPD